MGQLITKIYSHAAREVKIYNIERRAEKVISKDKPSPAPMFPSTIKELERLNEENVSKDYLLQKHKLLDENLKKVYVTTPDSSASTTNQKETDVRNDRPLPTNRFSDTDESYGYSESEEVTVPMGQLTLKQALQLIADHRTNPQQHTNTAIAAQYKLPITVTDDILEHFKMLNLHVKRDKEDPDEDSIYMKLHKSVENMNFLNVRELTKAFPQHFKKRTIFNKNKELKIKDKEDNNVDTNISDEALKDDKKHK